MKFKDKVVLITGGTRGIGESITRMFAGEGAAVVVNFRSNDDKAKEFIEEIRLQNGGKAELFKCSVSDYEKVEEMIKFTVEKFGRIDILINNAGVEESRLFCKTDYEVYKNVIDVNLIGVMNCCRAAINKMMKQKTGNIINISSVAGIHSNIGQSAYSASKAGVNAFTKAIAKEYARFGIRVNAVAPGYIKTDMAEEYEEKVNEMIPFKRFGTKEEVVSVVGFLAGNESSYCTGGIYIVDGGLIS